MEAGCLDLASVLRSCMEVGLRGTLSVVSVQRIVEGSRGIYRLKVLMVVAEKL